MKTLRKNQSTIKYALYKGKTEILDSNNLRTGKWKTTYYEAVTMKAYVSAARGEAQADLFGINLDYTKTLITTPDCPIDENSILWVDDLTGDHDYIVVQKAKSLNFTSYAIKKVKVTTSA